MGVCFLLAHSSSTRHAWGVNRSPNNIFFPRVCSSFLVITFTSICTFTCIHSYIYLWSLYFALPTLCNVTGAQLHKRFFPMWGILPNKRFIALLVLLLFHSCVCAACVYVCVCVCVHVLPFTSSFISPVILPFFPI